MAGKRQSLFKSYPTYSEAKTAGEKLAKQLHEGSPASALTASHADAALAALQHLEAFRQSTEKRLSLLESVSGYCAAISKAGTHSVNEAIEGYLSTVATVILQGSSCNQLVFNH